MKKILSLFAILLVAGNLMAAEITDTYIFTSENWTATMNENAANWEKGKAGQNFEPGMGVLIDLATSGANATSPKEYENVKKVTVVYSTEYSEGSIEIQIGTNDPVNIVYDEEAGEDATLVFDYDTPQSGAVKLTVYYSDDLLALYIKSITITYEYNSAESEILANKLDLGTKIIAIGNDSFVSDETIEVTGSNLSEEISVACESEYIDIDETSLDAEGGTLHLRISTTSAVAFADTIYLSSGEIVTKVPVVAKIKKNVALSGDEDATLVAGASVPVTVDGLSAVKVGTGAQGGSMTIRVPAYASKLRFYACSWADLPGTIVLSAPAGITLSSAELTLVDDAAVTGTAVSFTLDALTHAAFAQEITLTGVEEESQITLTSGSQYRFLVWGAKCDTEEPAPPVTDYTINYLAKDASVLETEVVTLNLPDAPVIPNFSFLYWKTLEGNIADGINIQAVYKSTATEAPAVVVNPANPSQKLIRDGNVYILHDNHTYTLTGAKVR